LNMSSTVEIVFQGFFREVAKERKVVEEVEEGITVAKLLKSLATKYGKDFLNIIDPESQKVSTEVLVMLNGRGIQATDIILKDKDVILVGVPIGGG